MARLFGALANAGAQYNKGRFAREQHEAEEQKIARDEARRAFEFGVTNDRLMEQAKEATALRKAAQERLNQQDQFEAIQAGAEDTPVESLAAASQAFLRGQGMGMPQQAVRAPQTARKVQQADGIDFSADPKGAPAYINAGGRVLRYDPQKAANASADKAMRDHLTKIMMEKERSAGDRSEIELRASLRPQPNPPQRRTQIVKDEKSGEYVIVDMDQVGPTGLTIPKTGMGAGGAKSSPVTSNERNKLADIQEIRRLALDAREKMQNINGFAGPFDKPFQRVKTMIGSPDMAKMEAMRAYQRLASPAARQTIGTAMTPQEIMRLDVWLPMLENTDENVIRAGVEGFFREADAIYRERMALMKASGINTDALEKLPAQFDAGRQSSTGTPARTGTKPSPREALGIPRGQ